MDIIPYEIVANTIVVLLALCGTVVLLVNTWKAIRDIRKPNADHIRMVLEHEEKLSNDYNDIAELKEEMRIVLSTLRPMLQHLIDGNNVDSLQEQLDFLDRYLINLIER